MSVFVSRKRAALAAFLVCIIGLGAWVAWRELMLTGPPRPLVNAYYVWQMQWTASVRTSIREAAPGADRMMVLLGEVNPVNDMLAFTPAQPDWKVLGDAGVPVTLVLRASVGLGPFLVGERREHTATYLQELLNKARQSAREKGTAVAGVQLDYDCPTSKLADYRRLLEALREALPGTDLSITVLPTWLKRWEFGRLVHGLTYYVLQVHSLQTPTTVDEPIVLCDTSQIPGYLRRTASVGVPFYIALPTYGYRVAFDAEGRFKALSAEGPMPTWDPTYQVRLVMTEPAEIVAVVRSVHAAPPRACRGFAWFRLPNSSDELNWTWPTLRAVSEGRVPVTSFQAEIRNPSPGLYEAWLSNSGETRVWNAVAFAVDWTGHRLLAHDVLGGFKGQRQAGSSSMRLVGPAPRGNEPAMVAWFRTEPDTLPPPAPQASTVEVME